MQAVQIPRTPRTVRPGAAGWTVDCETAGKRSEFFRAEFLYAGLGLRPVALELSQRCDIVPQGGDMWTDKNAL